MSPRLTSGPSKYAYMHAPPICEHAHIKIRKKLVAYVIPASPQPLFSPLPRPSALLLSGLGWLSYLSQAASEEMLHATPTTQSSHPSPCIFISALFFSQTPAVSETIAPIQRVFGNRKVLSREHVSQAQHGSQGLPCLPLATQESGKVNLCVCSQASCQTFWWRCQDPLSSVFSQALGRSSVIELPACSQSTHSASCLALI